VVATVLQRRVTARWPPAILAEAGDLPQRRVTARWPPAILAAVEDLLQRRVTARCPPAIISEALVTFCVQTLVSESFSSQNSHGHALEVISSYGFLPVPMGQCPGGVTRPQSDQHRQGQVTQDR